MSADATKALYTYLKLRARRDRLATMAPDRKGVVSEKFTPAEVEQLAVAETTINRLRGAAAIELLIANRSCVLSYISR